MAEEQLLADPGVLDGEPLLLFHAWQTLRAQPGCAVLAWRDAALQAAAAGVAWQPCGAPLPEGWQQAAVVAGKHRQALLADCLQAWALLRPGGRLLVCGSNAVGIRSSIKQLQQQLQQTGRQLANRAKARVHAFVREDVPLAAAPRTPAAYQISVPPEPTWQLVTAPGIFAAQAFDAGSAQLLAACWEAEPARQILDIGAGVGALSLPLLRRWPGSQACLLEADHRALLCAQRNIRAWDVPARAFWWDVAEPLPRPQVDLVLCNPPCHKGSSTSYDTGVAQQMFHQAARALRPEGRLMLVANRQLPYEQSLRSLFREVEPLRVDAGFKVLQARRPRQAEADA